MNNEENTYGLDINAAIDRQRAAECMLERNLFACRPSVMLHVKIFKDGNMWCALYGEDIMNGVSAFGETPEKASIAFDAAWNGQDVNG